MANREPESSLELLLDTMCNTFGGVMFVAISLVVIMTMLSKAEKALNQYDNQDIEKIQAECAAIQEKIKDRLTSIELKNKTLLIADSPQKQASAALAALEQELAVQTLAEKSAASKIKIAILEKARMDKNLSDLERKKQKLETLHADMIRKCTEQEDKIESLKKTISEKSYTQMTFKTIAPSNYTPFWVLVAQNKFWVLGPEKTDEGATPGEDVSFTVGSDGVIACRIKSDRGYPLMENGRISAQLRTFLSGLPPDRVPEFHVNPDSAADFSAVREVMKSESITHGVRTSFDGQTFFYNWGHTTYEY